MIADGGDVLALHIQPWDMCRTNLKNKSLRFSVSDRATAKTHGKKRIFFFISLPRFSVTDILFYCSEIHTNDEGATFLCNNYYSKMLNECQN